jgi:hypothetical protein
MSGRVNKMKTSEIVKIYGFKSLKDAAGVLGYTPAGLNKLKNRNIDLFLKMIKGAKK